MQAAHKQYQDKKWTGIEANSMSSTKRNESKEINWSIIRAKSNPGPLSSPLHVGLNIKSSFSRSIKEDHKKKKSEDILTDQEGFEELE